MISSPRFYQVDIISLNMLWTIHHKLIIKDLSHTCSKWYLLYFEPVKMTREVWPDVDAIYRQPQTIQTTGIDVYAWFINIYEVVEEPFMKGVTGIMYLNVNPRTKYKVERGVFILVLYVCATYGKQSSTFKCVSAYAQRASVLIDCLLLINEGGKFYSTTNRQ